MLVIAETLKHGHIWVCFLAASLLQQMSVSIVTLAAQPAPFQSIGSQALAHVGNEAVVATSIDKMVNIISTTPASIMDDHNAAPREVHEYMGGAVEIKIVCWQQKSGA
eukprot:scaffold597462_cov19-Prasinocladus_malaysianus.AAC.1